VSTSVTLRWEDDRSAARFLELREASRDEGYLTGSEWEELEGVVSLCEVVKPPAKRGQCSECRYRWRLRKDGTVQYHSLYSGEERHECTGSGKPPQPQP
jgi:hypothetical protein